MAGAPQDTGHCSHSTHCANASYGAFPAGKLGSQEASHAASPAHVATHSWYFTQSSLAKQALYASAHAPSTAQPTQPSPMLPHDPTASHDAGRPPPEPPVAVLVPPPPDCVEVDVPPSELPP